MTRIRTRSFQIPVTTSGAYAAGDVVGGIIEMTLANALAGRRVTVRSVQLNDKSGQAPALHVYFFRATPVGGTYADNAALVWGGGDTANKVGQLDVKAADYLTAAGQSSANFSGLDKPTALTGTSLFALLVLPAGSAPTIASGNLVLVVELDQE